MPRGGRRTGTPGKAYGNRSDLAVPAAAASGQTYGMKAQQMAAQRAIPIAAPPQSQAPAAPSATSPVAAAPPVLPGSVTSLHAPTERPGEPVTHGVPVGAGGGIEALGALGGGGDDVGMQLRALYSRFPNEDLRRVIEALDTDDGSGVS